MANLIINKKASFNYEILDTLEAGIELNGSEVKSLKDGHASFEGAFVTIQHGQAFLNKMHITAYQKKNLEIQGRLVEENRNRKLILHKKQIEKLMHESHANRMTIIPLRFYLKGPKIKLEIAIAKGKKKFDKRESIKKREDNIRARREVGER